MPTSFQLQPMLKIKTELTRALCVDLDGSLLATDVLWESLIVLLKSKPLKFFRLPFWLAKGKAYFKRQLALNVSLNVGNLPVRQEVLSFIKTEKQAGREIILATATDRIVADEIGQRFGLFSTVLASDGKINLSGRRKLEALKANCGDTNFDYIGDGEVDLPIWSFRWAAR